jgi:predicted glycogen debranching enzyme
MTVPSRKRSRPTPPLTPRSLSKAAFSAQLLPPPEAPTLLAPALTLDAEWLETDGLGGFASGTVSGIRTRREHAILLVAAARSARGEAPRTHSVVLVNGLDARIATQRGMVDISSHHYDPDVVHPGGHRHIESFTTDPWPTWVFLLEGGTRVEQQLFSLRGTPGVVLTWSVIEGPSAGARLMVRPLISGREAGALHHANPYFHSEAQSCDAYVRWLPYSSQPAILGISNGSYAHHHLWYHNFVYAEDRARGWEYKEDLGSPGIFHFNLTRGEAVLVLTTDEGLKAMKASASASAAGLPGFLGRANSGAESTIEILREEERVNRAGSLSRLHHAADAYLVRRRDRLELISDYPEQDESPTETFAALRGLCLATGRIEEARQILIEWARTFSKGVFPEVGRDAVEAPLWFTAAVHDFFLAANAAHRRVTAPDRKMMNGAIAAILEACVEGREGRIQMDEDGLLIAGEPGTPRAGKAVDVQALWLNALHIGSALSSRWDELYERGRASFERRFWNENAGCLCDVVDADHARGTADATVRVHQIFAVGGLPYAALDGERARRVVNMAEARFLTPMGLRSDRDPSMAHPWMLGPFVEAWARVRGDTPQTQGEARERFLTPLLERASVGFGHLPEALDAEPPHGVRGSPFHARSLAEALRLDVVLSEIGRNSIGGMHG